MNRTSQFAAAALLAAVGSASSFTALQAQTFAYNPQDLILGFRQTGGSSDLEVNIGQASLYYNATPGSILTIGQYDNSQLSSAFSSLDNLSFSISGAVRASGDPVNPIQTLWLTEPRLDLNTQTTPWLRQSQFSQGTVGGQIAGIGSGGVSYAGSIPAGPNNTPTALVIPDGDPNAYHQFIGDSGDFNGTFQGNVENATGTGFGAGGQPLRSDLYQLRPGTGAGTYLGYFELSPAGTMTFTAVPEPRAWSMVGLGGLLFVATQRLRQAK